MHSYPLSAIPPEIRASLNHNGVNVREYQSNEWFLLPFPKEKGIPFNADNLATQNLSLFQESPAFKSAKRAAEGRWGIDKPRDISWRLHVVLEAARSASSLHPEAFWVELGTGRGYMAAALCESTRNESQLVPPSRFFLFDTFLPNLQNAGRPSRGKSAEHLFFYADGKEEVEQYFSEFPWVRVVSGRLPRALSGSLENGKISLVLVDLNAATPEVESLTILEDLFCPGTLIVFDDSTNPGNDAQLLAHREWVTERGWGFFELPTGQALAIAGR